MFIRSGYSAQTRSVGSGTERHHHARAVVVGRRNLRPARGPQPGIGPLTLHRLGGDAVETHFVELNGQLAAGTDRFAPSLEHEAAVALTDRGRATAVDDPVAF